MPRYFFHTRIGEDLVEDPAGLDLRDPDQAWDVAHDSIHAMMAGAEHQARLIGACLVVVDEAGETVLEFPFAEAMMAGPRTGGSLH